MCHDMHLKLNLSIEFITTGNYISYLLEERRVLPQVFRNHIETEQVTIDALSCHCQAVQALVFLCCPFEQLETLFSLDGQGTDKGKYDKQLKRMICMLE